MLPVKNPPSLGSSHPRVKGGGVSRVGKNGEEALALSGDQLLALSLVSLPFISSSILMTRSPWKQKSVIEGTDLPGYTDHYWKSTV